MWFGNDGGGNVNARAQRLKLGDPFPFCDLKLCVSASCVAEYRQLAESYAALPGWICVLVANTEPYCLPIFRC